MTARRYDADYREEIRLADGSTAVLRCLRRDDRALLVEGFSRLSPESRYFRFFSAKAHLSDAELDYLCDIDLENHFALGAVRPDVDGVEHGLGIARFIRLPDRPDIAESAIAVADDIHGLGLGTALMNRLIEAAAERGVHWFRLHLLGTNRGMKHLLADVSDDVAYRAADDGVLTATLPVPGAAEGEVPAEAPGDSAAKRILKGAAEKVVDLAPLARRRQGR